MRGATGRIPYFRCLSLIVLMSVLTSCRERNGQPESGRTPVVSLDGHYLYRDELADVMLPGLSVEDSTEFADKYIRNWISDILLYENASKNVSDVGEIDELVENYRRTLIVHSYQQKLVEQKSVGTVSESEIISFYNDNKDLFVLDRPVIKGVLIKLPSKAPNISKVRNWYVDTKEKSLDELEKYCILNAVRYEPFYETWMDISQVESVLPKMSVSLEKYLSQKRHLEVTDESFIYFLNVTDIVERGETEPLEMAYVEIERLLENNKEVKFIEQMKEDLYKKALARDRIVFF